MKSNRDCCCTNSFQIEYHRFISPLPSPWKMLDTTLVGQQFIFSSHDATGQAYSFPTGTNSKACLAADIFNMPMSNHILLAAWSVWLLKGPLCCDSSCQWPYFPTQHRSGPVLCNLHRHFLNHHLSVTCPRLNVKKNISTSPQTWSHTLAQAYIYGGGERLQLL